MDHLQRAFLLLFFFIGGVHPQNPINAIVFPDEDGNFILPPEADIRSASDDTVKSLPSDYEPRLDTLSTLSDFANYFEIADQLPLDQPLVSTRLGGGGQPAVEDLTQARCIPEPKVVSLELPQEARVTYFPSCVRVTRCGGCCFAPQHTCQPTLTEEVKVKVVIMSEAAGDITNQPPRRGRSGSRNRRRADMETVSVERHLECKCDCIVKSESCNALVHVYNPNTCSCDCNNKGEEEACRNKSSHYWNKETCACHCRNFHRVRCSSGRSFSHATCECI